MLTEEKKGYFKNLLTQRLDELLEEANKTQNGMIEQKENFPDPNDQATAESDMDVAFRIRERERELMREIDEALAMIKNGTYGICEECEEEIGEGRLEANPVTTLCIECKTEMENEGRARRL